MSYHHEKNVDVAIRDAESSTKKMAPHPLPPATKPPEDYTTCSSTSSTCDDYSCATVQIKNSMSFRSPNDTEVHEEVSASRRGKVRNCRSGFFSCLRPPKGRRTAKRNRNSSQEYPDFEDPPRLNLPQYSDTEEDLLPDNEHSVPDSLVERFIVVYYNRNADLYVKDCHADSKTVPSSMQSLDEECQLSEAVETVLDSQRLEKVQRQVLLEPTGNFQLLYWGIALTQY